LSALAELQRSFAAVLMDGAPRTALEAAVRGDERASAAERVAVYADMYRLRLLDVLSEIYRRTRALLGDAGFDEVAQAYLYAHPSRSPSLRSFGDGFAAHLAAMDRLSGAPALALLEWTRYDVFDARDQAPLTRDRLTGLDAETIAALPLRAHDACRLISCATDADALYRTLAHGPVRPSVVASPTRLLVWRDRHTVYHRVVPVRETALLERVLDGTSLGSLCEVMAADQPVEAAAIEVFALVGRWIADGVLADPDVP
jgi:hypothetical protein